MIYPKIRFIFALLIFSSDYMVQAQNLKPGFDPVEYLDLLQVCEATHKDSTQPGDIKGSALKSELIYRSSEMGLKNRWEFWQREDGVGIISIRGTVQHPSSWMENFYSAQVPAMGALQINDSTNFAYKLSNDEKASVHVGWTLGLAHIGPDILQFITRMNQEKNTSQFIIMGHSQGGALAFLVTSYLHYLIESGSLSGQLSFKTYCSAAPKPGNMYYAYDFDFITRNGKGFNIVNAADWVPETPPTVQTFSDINPTNPFYNAETLLGKQKWPANWYLKNAYKKIKRLPHKTLRRYQKYFGHKVFSQVNNYLPEMKEPLYSPSSNFMRTGTPIVLMPDSSYYIKYPEKNEKIFIHHSFESYKYLVEKIYLIK